MPNQNDGFETAEISFVNSSHIGSKATLTTRGGISYSPDIATDLSSQFNVYDQRKKDKDLSQFVIERQSDWDYLQEAIQRPHTSRGKAVREFLSKPASYRFRFDEHFEAARQFILKVTAYNGHFFQEIPRLTMDRYRQTFNQLCSQDAKLNPVGKYRLCDLISNVLNAPIKTMPVKPGHFLAFLFAVGVGDSVEPSSLAYFVARFQFFEKFLLQGWNTYKAVFGFYNGEEITSDYFRWLFECANDVWKNSLGAGRNLSSNSNKSLPQQLWNRLQNTHYSDPSLKALVPKIQRFFSHHTPGFKTAHDVVVHIFRHMDEIHHYHGISLDQELERKKAIFPERSDIYESTPLIEGKMKESIQKLILDYEKMILGILSKSTEVKWKRDQFGGYKFTFLDSNKRLVTAAVLPDRVSFILTCY